MTHQDQDLKYFLCFPQGDRGRVAIIDIQSNLYYEREDWDTVNDEWYDTLIDAVSAADKIAEKLGIVRERFESRYDENLNEPDPKENADLLQRSVDQDYCNVDNVRWLLIHYRKNNENLQKLLGSKSFRVNIFIDSDPE